MNVFDKLAAEEAAFFNSQLFSPVLKGKPIRVRISGVIVTLNVTKPKNFEGWGVFAPTSAKTAKFVREPNMTEKQSYFNLFPALRLILCRRSNEQWFGIPANQSDNRFKITGTVPIQLCTEVQMFDMVQVRFDGNSIWFEQIDPKHSLKAAAYLRESVIKFLDAAKLELPGLTIEERDAYLIALNDALAADAEARRDKQEERIQKALALTGAKYQSYIERGNTFTIEFMVGRERHRSVVKKDTLAVESAGICLAGTDKNFDLQSLVGVIREGQRTRRIVRVGDNRQFGNPDEHGYEQEDYNRQLDGEDDY
jgi:hypothetical protein